MTYIISHPEVLQKHTVYKEAKSVLSKFIQWATDEDENHHIAWIGVSVTSMAALFFPLTMAVILLNGASFGLIMVAMFALVLVFITNLASLPTRYTIPAFFLGILIDVGAIIACFLFSFNGSITG